MRTGKEETSPKVSLPTMRPSLRAKNKFMRKLGKRRGEGRSTEGGSGQELPRTCPH